MSITSEIRFLGSPCCLDLETAMWPECNKGRDYVRLLQFHSDNGEHWYDLKTFTDAQWDELKVVLGDPSITWVGQNISFDYRVLLGCGIRLKGRLEDTLVQSALLNNGLVNVSNGLESIAKRVLGVVLDKTLQAQDWMNADLNEADLAYAMDDVRVTWKAWHEQRAMVKTAGLQRVYALECALIPVVVEMEATGMLVDQEQARAAIEQLEGKIDSSKGEFLELLDAAMQELHNEGLPREADGSYNLRAKNEGRGAAKKLAGFNINSTQQVLSKLQSIGVDPLHPKTGKPSTDKTALKPFGDVPAVNALTTYKRAEKRRSMIQSILDKHLAEDGRIHPQFNPLRTGTGRFSSSNPNAQQFPREAFIRDVIAAQAGFDLIGMDVKNMEMGVACSAPIANELLMQQALRDKVDLHTLTAHLIFNAPIEEVDKDQRQRAKSCNFGLLFGSGAPGLKDYFASFGYSITLDEAREFREAWLKSYPAMAEWHRKAKWEVEHTGEVRMVDGRRRWLIGDQARPTVWLNNLVQGTAASIVKRTMVGVWPKLPTGARFIAQVHDELIVEAPEGSGDEVLQLMKDQLAIAGREILGDSVLMEGEGAVAKSWGQIK